MARVVSRMLSQARSKYHLCRFGFVCRCARRCFLRFRSSRLLRVGAFAVRTLIRLADMRFSPRSDRSLLIVGPRPVGSRNATSPGRFVLFETGHRVVKEISRGKIRNQNGGPQTANFDAKNLIKKWPKQGGRVEGSYFSVLHPNKKLDPCGTRRTGAKSVNFGGIYIGCSEGDFGVSFFAKL